MPNQTGKNWSEIVFETEAIDSKNTDLRNYTLQLQSAKKERGKVTKHKERNYFPTNLINTLRPFENFSST